MTNAEHKKPGPDQSGQTVHTMTGAEVLLQVLVDLGVDVIFGYPGGAVLPIYDAIFQQDKIRHILTRHEQAAVHAAEAYARSTGKIGVALVTSGPGATNTVTGLVDALMDSIPIVCISGQVFSSLIGNDAFQEADTVGITRAATKFNYLVKDKEKLADKIREAFYIAGSGRPGPVLIDIPKDLQMAQVPYSKEKVEIHPSYKPVTEPNHQAIKDAVKAMRRAKRPIFYTGGGIINSGPRASEGLRKLVKLSGFPCTSTLMGLGAYPASDKQFLGMLGMHGTYEANLATHGCDVLVALGARFDDRVTGSVKDFSPNALKIHADIDPSQINKIVLVDIPIIGDVARTIDLMIEEWERNEDPVDQVALREWWEQIEQWRAVDCLKYQQDMQVGETIKPQHAIRRLSELANAKGKEAYISTEVGQHQMWAAQYFPFESPNHFMTSGGLGTMGYGLPAAVGIQVAHPDALVIDIAGEASTMMNIQELATIKQYRLPLKVFILNNRYMGMVRQWQELIHGGRYSESYSESLPDFVKLAESFGIKGMRARTIDELDSMINAMLDEPGPVVMEIQVEREENCFPMIPAGAPHNQILLGPVKEKAKAAS
ncbi:biosynthetic-type acetolactate synthase large subunit [Commensalibacter papalotli (ex Botero et al. 2024)]|uniref:Acetolactate synthase n=1 Tax=Commensalibacter papalotli (ex Botero et al. 2024) TaxID=2972766 RepID=A0ABM9HPR8_9PROT|nr:biosynthetic-type acetolactate synthase large subunit [Commensalibacter papalotli (ex Botero et al. 2024)]CAI3931987.1 Acetolactate synthase large subunit or other thiamine pyrophosphate-requiring enzyme (IlvB) (PDB:1BFD) [Commensalibacter papalotli (ex Botero et al. 2024)]CAI3943708.1 Acetolactate synthase large subunit or other thiamine pyrophosphate-requiring enzyme (IlvB) (PDB:1BFD) [Commensalibacter papalotli (ex Botero et al. 2024)]